MSALEFTRETLEFLYKNQNSFRKAIYALSQELMQSLKKIKSIDLAVAALFLSFLFAYFGIAHYNRVMQDDFLELFMTKTHGIIQPAFHYYKHLEGALVWYVWPHLTTWINQYNTHVSSINLLNIILYFTSLLLLLTQVMKKLLPVYSLRIPLILCILSVTTILYFRNDIVNQAVFWLTGSGYMTLISLLYLGIYFLLKGGPLNIMLSALLLFSFALVKLHYSVIEMGILFYFLLWYFLKNKKINKQVLLLLGMAALGFAIYMVAPGNYAGRFNAELQGKLFSTPLLAYVKQFILSLACYFFIHILKSLPLLLINFSLAFIFGLTDDKNTIPKPVLLEFGKFSIYTIIMSWCSLALVMTAIYLNHGNTRTFFFPYVISVLLLNISFYFLGTRLRGKTQFLPRLALPIAFIACAFFIYFFLSDRENLRKLDQAFDKRIETILEAKKTMAAKDTLFLPVLPYSKTLMSNELRGGVYLEWQQDLMKQYYETPFQLKLVPTKP